MLTEEQLAAIHEQHGPVIVVETVEGPIAFKRPSRTDFNRYQEKLFAEKTRHTAAEWLERACCVFPKDFDLCLERHPGIITTCAGPLLEHAGVDTEAETKNSETDSAKI